MIKFPLAALALLLPLAASAQPAPRAPTTLTVSASARVERAPDVAEIGAGVTTIAPTAAEASRTNAAAMTRVIAAVRAARIAERDIQTSGLGLSPVYDYQERSAPRLTGYQATNTVNVRLRALDRAGATIDALVAAGANQISGPTFRVTGEDGALDEARTAAVGKARARAELYARAAGMRLGRIARIVEGGGEVPRPIPVMRTMMAAKAEATPVQPGEIALEAQVTIDFELE